MALVSNFFFKKKGNFNFNDVLFYLFNEKKITSYTYENEIGYLVNVGNRSARFRGTQWSRVTHLSTEWYIELDAFSKYGVIEVGRWW